MPDWASEEALSSAAGSFVELESGRGDSTLLQPSSAEPSSVLELGCVVNEVSTNVGLKSGCGGSDFLISFISSCDGEVSSVFTRSERISLKSLCKRSTSEYGGGEAL